MNAAKLYWVEDHRTGGYSDRFTFEQACKIAEQDSIEFSSLMVVRHETGYVPTRIYYCGHVYEQVEKGKNES